MILSGLNPLTVFEFFLKPIHRHEKHISKITCAFTHSLHRTGLNSCGNLNQAVFITIYILGKEVFRVETLSNYY